MICDFFYERLNFLYENLNFLYENLRVSLSKIFKIFFMIFFRIHEISYYKVRVSTGSVETRWLGGNFSMVYRNNAGRLGSGFISVCFETRWLGQKGGFFVLERPCTPLKSPTTDVGLSIRLSMFELRETGDWDIFLVPPERVRAETGGAD